MQRQPAGVAVVAMFPSVLTEGGRVLKIKIKIVKTRKGWQWKNRVCISAGDGGADGGYHL